MVGQQSGMCSSFDFNPEGFAQEACRPDEEIRLRRKYWRLVGSRVDIHHSPCVWAVEHQAVHTLPAMGADRQQAAIDLGERFGANRLILPCNSQQRRLGFSPGLGGEIRCNHTGPRQTEGRQLARIITKTLPQGI